MPCKFGHDANGQAVNAVGAAEQVLHEQLATLRVSLERVHQRIEVRRCHRLVVVPPDVFLDRWFTHHELVAGRTSGVDAGLNHERSVLGEEAFLA